MNIQLPHLELTNFKGAKNMSFDFTTDTNVFGANEKGKTRIVDAWNFLLFGKDSQDRKDFSIKSLDANNKSAQRVDHSVRGTLSIDGKEMTFERTYKEKWQKKHGEEETTFTGHETEYSINGVPVLQKEYNEQVNDILPESLFKQLTNPGYFNSMNWSDRRAMLFKVAGDIEDKDVIAANTDLKDFLELLAGRPFDKFKAELAAKIKPLKEQKKDIPARIDEVGRAILPDPDYNQINLDITRHTARLHQIDGLLSSDAEKHNKHNKDNQERQNKIYEIRTKINDLYFLDKSKADNLNNDLKEKKTRLTDGIKQLQDDVASFEDRSREKQSQKDGLVKENDKLRNDWEELNSSELIFDENEFICPACKREFETDDIESKKNKMLADFNTSKADKLKKITETGTVNKKRIDALAEDIVKLALQITGYGESIKAKRTELDAIVIPETPPVVTNPEIVTLEAEIKTIEGQITTIGQADNSELTKEKAEINNSLDELKKALNIKSENERHKIRKQELIDQEKSLSQQITDLERQEFKCELFTRTKVDMIEDKVNGMFTYVKFKMFNRLVNGALEETCDCLINGVPYQDANNAARINAGIDIINTLSKHYGVYAPIFVDNAEAVNEVFKSESQMIKLFVIPPVPENEPAKSEYVQNYSSKGILLM